MEKFLTKNDITTFIEMRLPTLAHMCTETTNAPIIMHTDMIGRTLSRSDMVLIGYVIKYCAFHGREIRFHGKHEETIKGNVVDFFRRGRG